MKIFYKKYFIFILLIFTLVFTTTLIKHNKQEIFADTTYSNWIELYNSYQDYSYDYKNTTLPAQYCLRDEYMIYAEQQFTLGLCWNFGSHTALETTIMKATGEALDFSEAWISTALTYADKYNYIPNYNLLSSDQYINGDGGWFVGFDLVAKKYGLVLEQDFKYEYAYEVTNKNVDQYYDLYGQYVDNDIYNDYVPGRFDIDVSNKKTTAISSIKNHIMNHGGIATSMKFGDSLTSTTYKSKKIFFKKPSTNVSTGHLMSIIGWDDNIQVTYSGKTYKGAWIAMNSYGNEKYYSSGDEGIIYLFYDDTDYTNKMWGYKYVGDIISSSLEYNDEIVESNASYTTSLCGAYYGNFSTSNKKTLQKNIFYNQSNINLSYEYEISTNASIKNIFVYKGQKDVTTLFNIINNTAQKTINISASNLATGSYKIIIEYSNSSATRNHTNQFFVFDGTELSYVHMEKFSNLSYNTVKNNGQSQLYNAFDSQDNTFIFATSSTNTTEYFWFGIIFASYHSITSVNFNSYCTFNSSIHNKLSTALANNILPLQIEYSPNSLPLTYNFVLTTSSGKSKTIKLKIIKLNNSTNDALTQINYSLDGGDNSLNQKKLIVNKTNGAILSAPTRTGYNFKGWYYSKDFSASSKLSTNSSGDYILEYSKLYIETSPTVYYTSSFSTYWGNQINVAFVYAKFEIATYTVTFQSNGGTALSNQFVKIGEKATKPNSPTKTGYNFEAWYKDSTFSTIWDFDVDHVNSDMTLYAKYSLKPLTNVNLSIDNTNLYIGKEYTLTLKYEHELKPSGTVSITWYKNNSEFTTTTSNTLKQAADNAGYFEFYAIITFGINNEKVYEKTNTVNFEIIDINEITINYNGNGLFEISDPDSYISTYTINIYGPSTHLSSYSTTSKIIDISDFITTSGIYSISVQKSYNNITLSWVRKNISIYQISYSNLSDYTNFKTLLVDEGYILTEPVTPNRAGLTFSHWEANNNQINFPYTISANTELIAKWNLNGIQNALISAEIEQFVETPFELNISFEHELMNSATIRILWYRNNNLTRTTNSNTLIETLTSSGEFSYYAIINLTYDNISTSVTTNTININATYNLRQITIKYLGNGVFSINDLDNYSSNFNVSIYQNNKIIKTYSSNSKQIDINSNINASGKYKINVIKSFDTVTLPAVISEEIEIVKITYSNLIDYTNYGTKFVDTGYSLTKPTSPARQGYNFIGWKVNNTLVDFPYTITQDTQLFATWQFKEIQNFVITANQNQFVDHAFELTISFEHDLKDSATLSISWYRDNSLIDTTHETSITDTLLSSGSFDYYAILKLSYGHDSSSATTTPITIHATYNLSPISINYNSQGIFEIIDKDKYSSLYHITEYFNNNAIKTYSTNTKIIDINSIISTYGKYHIIVVKSYNDITLESVTSEKIEIYEISYSNLVDDINYPTILVDKGYSLSQPVSPAKLGYNFNGWTVNDLNINFPYTINDNIQLVANWQIKELENIILTANPSQFVDTPFDLTLSFVHELINSANITIYWFRNNNLINTTQTLSITDTLTTSGQYVYYAKVELSFDKDITSANSNNVNINVIYELSAITLNYKYSGIFEIIDNDSYSSTYQITEYYNGEILKTYNTQNKIVDINSSITSSGKYKLAVIKTFDNVSLDEVISSEVEIVELLYSNLTDYTNYQAMFVDKGYLLIEPILPIKTGYNFNGWKVDSDYISFPYILNENTNICAEWSLKDIQNMVLNVNQNQFVNLPFDLTVSYEHELKSDIELTVVWYKNNANIASTSTLIYNENIFSSGMFEYFAILYLTHENNTVSQTSNTVTITAIYKLAEINLEYLGNSAYQIIDTDNYNSIYSINVYRDDNLLSSSQTLEKLIDISQFITQKGNYKIGVIKNFDGQALTECISSIIEIFKITLIKNTAIPTEIDILYKEKNSYITNLNDIEQFGYTFVGWFLNSECTLICHLPLLIDSDIEIFGSLKLNSINIDCITSLSFEYDGQNHNIAPTVNHELIGGEYTFAWKKQNDDTFTLQNQILSVKNVSDSGVYYCNISYEYNGDIANSRTENITVEISKAQTQIDTSGIQKEFTYDSYEHIINSGVIVNRQTELPNIVYSNNIFTDVPINNVLRVKIVAEETANYLSCTVYQNIFVHQAQSVITADTSQTFTYCKDIITPIFELNNTEQNIEFSENLINVGQYNIIIYALESQNYLPCQKEVSITINPADITLKVKDITSLWLLGLQDFSYEIQDGQVFDGDNINEEYFCDATSTSIGTFKISMTASNSNYNINIIDGSYTITVIPHIILAVAIFVLILTLIIIHLVRKHRLKNITKLAFAYAKKVQDKNIYNDSVDIKSDNTQNQKNTDTHQTKKPPPKPKI